MKAITLYGYKTWLISQNTTIVGLYSFRDIIKSSDIIFIFYSLWFHESFFLKFHRLLFQEGYKNYKQQFLLLKIQDYCRHRIFFLLFSLNMPQGLEWPQFVSGRIMPRGFWTLNEPSCFEFKAFKPGWILCCLFYWLLIYTISDFEIRSVRLKYAFWIVWLDDQKSREPLDELNK